MAADEITASPSESAPPSAVKFCQQPAHCPICGEPNRCRLETGEPYKGPCWCETPILPASAVRRLLADLPEPRCLCRPCLEQIANDPEVAWEALIATRRTAPTELLPGDTYLEGDAVVFTEQYHLRRGHCCANGCRHCPYGMSPAPARGN